MLNSRPSGFGMTFLVGGLLLALAGGAALLGMPLWECPNCHGSGIVIGPPVSTWEEKLEADGTVSRRNVTKPWPIGCPVCNASGETSLFKRWKLRRTAPAP